MKRVPAVKEATAVKDKAVETAAKVKDKAVGKTN
jgi:hypothetical protein